MVDFNLYGIFVAILYRISQSFSTDGDHLLTGHIIRVTLLGMRLFRDGLFLQALA